jgi:hypothetical protein
VRSGVAAAVALLAVAACGDNAVAPVDAAPPSRPDLTLIAAEMDDSILIVPATIEPDDCALVEDCVGGPGERRLLEFDTVTANVGTGDLELGEPPPAGVSAGMFVWSPCHMHHHIGGYAAYELRDAAGVVVTGHKQAFCLQDVEQVQPATPSQGFTCTRQGLSAGWADVYSRGVACQWIDVTDVPPGTYTVEVRINATSALPDADRSNNTWITTVVL